LDKFGQNGLLTMARRIRDKDLETKAARAKLRARGKPYYRAVAPGLHLGYRKGKRACPWVVRFYTGDRQYQVESIGTADDFSESDGVHILDFWQAQDCARALHKQRAGGVLLGPYTVRRAIDDYLISIEGKASHYSTARHLVAYAGTIADKELAKLTSDDLETWHAALAKMPPRVRSKRGQQQAHGMLDLSDPEAVRRRQSSANKALRELKAALNRAWRKIPGASDAEWRKVKPFSNASAARVRYLTIAESQRLINASDPLFRPLARTALETGARYSELARLRCSDFNIDSGTLLVRTSKSGKPRHIVLTEQGHQLFAQLTAGRGGDDQIIAGKWRRGTQARPMRAACQRAGIDPPMSFHGLRHTWASLAVMGGMPLTVVAKNLGHANTAMVEKHYGHLSEGYIAREIRASAPRFDIVEPSNVKALR
jgi:integrase